MTLYIQREAGGYIQISEHLYYSGYHYLGYTKKQALAAYRASHGLKGKHITVVDLTCKERTPNS